MQDEEVCGYRNTRSRYDRRTIQVSYIAPGQDNCKKLTTNRYMCRDPKQIKFAPLNRDTEHTAEELMTIFEVSLVTFSGAILCILTLLARPSFGPVPPSDQGCTSLPNHLRLERSCSIDASYHQFSAYVCSSRRASGPYTDEIDSKIVPGKTKNIFIDTTATDKTKL